MCLVRTHVSALMVSCLRQGRAWVWRSLQAHTQHVHTSAMILRARTTSVESLPTHIPSATKLEPLSQIVATKPTWPPLAEGVLANMQAFPQCVLLTRVGGFYESYFEQAPEVASLLGIKLASRKWASQSIPMAGFPLHQLEKYLKVLVQDHGRLVAICEEFKLQGDEAPFQRRVTRVVSPGTLIDERFLDPFRNNFILAITENEGSSYGLAWLDVSTADFQTGVVNDPKSLRDEVARIAPREVVLVLGHSLEEQPVWDVIDRLGAAIARMPADDVSTEDAIPTTHSVSSREHAAIHLLTSYLKTRLMEHMPGILVGETTRPSSSRVMHLDAATFSALEIRETSERSARGSLASIMRRTVTQSGARLFLQWLTLPSTSMPLIQSRHAMVELFLRNAFLRRDMQNILRTQVGDVPRTLQRISLRRNDEQDLLEIRDFIRANDQLQKRLSTVVRDTVGGKEVQELLSRFLPVTALGERLENAIDERILKRRLQEKEAQRQQMEATHGVGSVLPAEEPSRPRKRRSSSATLELEDEYWGDDIEHLIRPDSSPQLQKYTKQYNKLRKEARNFENTLRVQYQEPITLRHLLGQGHIVHFPSVRGEPDADMTLAYKTKTTRTFYHAEWTRIGMKLQKLRTELEDCESEMLEQLRLEVLEYSSALRRNARLVDQIDVLLGFAQAAEELNLVRPVMNESSYMNIVGGRHLGVEMGLLERAHLFRKNDLDLGQRARLHLITGPNMGGKSTFLRQNAIISVLAQAGSFVPADTAHLGIVDAIFSRVGARDDLFHSRSTFMVEMTETADILQRATRHSLVIADEVGRGTNTSVGLAMAFSVLHTLATKIQCRTLFATHYYELAEMLGFAQPAEERPLSYLVDFFCTRVERRDQGLLFSHHVQPGVNSESHGLDVARMADMPPDTMDLATRVHDWLVQHDNAQLNTRGLVQDILPKL